ncbi:MAG: hydrogenase expression/formation protein HypE [Anaerolineales bacterium]|nr:hydrogenase expression/formation protein HypE [Anaerolineales bacterium]
MQGPVCPRPIRQWSNVMLGHGSGGKMTEDLIKTVFYPAFSNPILDQGNDAGVFTVGDSPGESRWAVSTDGHIVTPLFFPGGDIGRLAICGSVNDLAMVGARPAWMAANFIMEEGLPMDVVERVAASMKAAAEEAGVLIVAGDTKVAERTKVDKLFITTTAFGRIPNGRQAGGQNARSGDAVLLSGPIGDHGIAVLAARGDLAFEVQVESDIAPLNHLIEAMFNASGQIHVLRDPTRGGLGTTLNEIACQSEVAVLLDEQAIPVRPAVRSACELLGFDPLYVANEGKLVAMVPEEDAERVLKAMRAAPYGGEACRIGEIAEAPQGRVLLRTALGSTRVVTKLSGEMLPRIC